ncbi:MAG TPA: N-acetylmuramic acid 6-phosphate etherase [Candidatus Deferrimicrobium sp.]|nr:N-acetylmuramic acid 6-phosphate etherase [Candidatus Deferrimicrobium sp.]
MIDREALIKQLSRLQTEQVNENTIDIDSLPPIEIVKKINAEDHKVAAIVEKALPLIAKAAELFAATIKAGGRIFYIGAGTSGRLGVLDAAECPPTFGTDPAQIIGIISGGYETLVLSREGVEDDTEAAAKDLQAHGFSRSDLLIGLAASTRTPYTLAGLEYAHRAGAKTVFVVCNRSDGLPSWIDIVIDLPVGPEVITGSTRMKSGTAQKMVLNLISTTAMVLLGKTYGNLMVDLQARSEKLAARSRKILMDLLALSYQDADSLLTRAAGSVKTAIVMYRFACAKEEAEGKLQRAGGFVGRCE